MQAAGTLRGTRAISLLILLVPLIGYAYSAPLQYLPSIPGYVPVYIRYGDQPLEDINPDLAKAFGETSNSAKSLQLDHTLSHVSNSFRDNDIDPLLEEEDSKKKHAYPLQVRATESRSFATRNDDETGNRNPNKPKLLTIYELPNENETRPRRRYRGRTRSRTRNQNQNQNENQKAPAFKVSPLSDEEIERLEKLGIEKGEIKPNELDVSNSKPPELPPEVTTRNRHRGGYKNGHNFVAPTKIQNPLGDDSPTNLSKLSQAADISRNDHGVTTSEADKEEPTIKQQYPARILSNVDKISPIDLLDEKKTDEDNKM